MNKPAIAFLALALLPACTMVQDETDAEFACSLISSRCHKTDEGANAGPLHKQATETGARDPRHP